MTTEAMLGCPFCGSIPRAFRAVPKGWNVLINHKSGCVIAQLKGLQVTDLAAFTRDWNTRCSPPIGETGAAVTDPVNHNGGRAKSDPTVPALCGADCAVPIIAEAAIRAMPLPTTDNERVLRELLAEARTWIIGDQDWSPEAESALLARIDAALSTPTGDEA